jgi:ER-bound oxygenase mpaB/B'/Rubber oxygenase, catalytic domain
MFDMEDLVAMRRVGDPIADEVVHTHVRDASTEQAMTVLAALTRTLRGLDDSPLVAAWVNSVEPAPTWVDASMVVRGQDVFRAWSLDIVTSLFCASLPFAYAAAQGVEVLERMSQLAEPNTIARRIAETGQMLLDVCEPGGLAPGGRGHHAARTVRLLHAVIRARLTMTAGAGGSGAGGEPWDSAVLGVPVNQEDLLGTLLSFTTVVFRSLDRMGVPLGPSDQACYLQMWATVGDLLGITSAESVLRPDAAAALTDVMTKELQAPSAAGVHLMDVLLAEMELSMPWGLRKLPRTLVRHLSGDPVADMLSVPPGAWWGGLFPMVAALNRATARFPAGRAVLQAPSRLLGRSMIRMWIDRTILGEGPTTMHIDADTASRLGVHTAADRSVVGLRGQLRGFRRAARRQQRAKSNPSAGGR